MLLMFEWYRLRYSQKSITQMLLSCKFCRSIFIWLIDCPFAGMNLWVTKRVVLHYLVLTLSPLLWIDWLYWLTDWLTLHRSIDRYELVKTMCRHGYHDHVFVATHVLWYMMHGLKLWELCTITVNWICHKVMVLTTGGHIVFIYRLICKILSNLRDMNHLWPIIWLYTFPS